MCIIIYKPKGKSVPLERLFNAKDRNPHGFGISWAFKKKLHIFKTMDFDLFLEKYSKVSKFDCLIHFRFATKGKKEKINCHPFRINKNLVMTHNGTIQDLDGTSHERSDSRTFAHSYVKPMVNIKSDFVNSSNGKRWMKGMISMQTNKLVFMNHHGTPTFINGDLGHWSMGCWYSPETYKARHLPSHSFTSRKSIKGYKHLSRKPKAIPNEIVQGLPINYGKLRSGRSLIDEVEDELQGQVDLWGDVQDQMEQNQLDCNTSEGFDCAEDDTLE